MGHKNRYKIIHCLKGVLTTCQVSNDTGSCSVRYIGIVGNLALDTLSRGGNTLDLLALPERGKLSVYHLVVKFSK